MRERVLVGTSDGLHELGGPERGHLAGCEVAALAVEPGRWWAIVGGRALGRLDASTDGGRRFGLPAKGLRPVQCVALA